MQAANPELAIEFADQFALTKKFALQNLQSAALLALTVPSAGQAGSSASVTVRVTNRTGHKLPTGYADGRRVVVQLSVDGQIFTGDFDAGSLINDGQLRVYEAQHGRAAIGVSDHLALHEAVVKDSRIPPAGMVATAATQPVAVSWFDQSDGGLRDYDETTFAVPLAPTLSDGAKVKVVVRLLYQSTTPEYVAFRAAENRTDTSGQRLQQIYEATGRGPPIQMAQAEGELTVSRPQLSTVDAGTGSEGVGSCHCQSGSGVTGLAVWLLLAGRRKKKSPQPGHSHAER